MHVERHGGPPDLQAAFTQFVVKVLRGRSLDDQRDVEARLGKFPDFACFRDLILLEMKHLEAEQTDRLNEVYQSKADPAEAPVFYGSRSIDKDLDKLSTTANEQRLEGTLPSLRCPEFFVLCERWLVDKKQTEFFKTFCDKVEGAKNGDRLLQKQLKSRCEAAAFDLDKIVKNQETFTANLAEHAKNYTEAELKILRKGEPIKPCSTSQWLRSTVLFATVTSMSPTSRP